MLFDIDGTLIHSAGAGRAAIERALVDVYGTAGPIDDLPFDGLTDPRIAHTLLRAAGLTEGEIDAGLNALWTEYSSRLAAEIDQRRDGMRTAPGVPEILDALEAAEAVLGLVTGNIAAGAEAKLSACGLWTRFAFGAFGSDDADRSALPPIAIERAFAATGMRFGPEETWIIGDTPQDIACGHASGLRVLAVATGRFSVADLGRAGAEHVLPSLEDGDRVMTALDSRSRAGVP